MIRRSREFLSILHAALVRTAVADIALHYEEYGLSPSEAIAVVYDLHLVLDRFVGRENIKLDSMEALRCSDEDTPQ